MFSLHKRLESLSPMKTINVRDLLLAALAAVAIYLLYFAPDHVAGIDAGIAGSLILLGAGWLTLYLWSRAKPVAGTAWSLGEQLATLSLGVTVAIAFLFILKLGEAGWQVSRDDPAAYSLGRNVLLMLVLWPLLGAAIKARAGTAAIEDERDRDIAARAGSHAHIVLVIALVGLVLNLGFAGSGILAYATPFNVAHWLIGVLILSIVAENLSAVVQYRRDRE